MYELTPAGTFAWSFDIARDGAKVGSIALRLLKQSATLELDGRSYQVTRQGLFGAFIFSDAGREVARAERTAFLAVRYRITAQDRILDLVARGFLRRTAQLLHGDVVIATISRTSLVRRTIHVDAVDEAPVPLTLFAAALMILFWRHQSRAHN